MQDIIIDECIICGSHDIASNIPVSDHLITNDTFILAQCGQCAFRFIQNPPAESVAHRYYETEEYVEHSDSKSGFINRVYHWARKWMLTYKYRLIKNKGTEKSILDFGTGTGYFLNFIKSKGFEVMGIEVNTKAQIFGQENFGLDIRDPQVIFQEDMKEDFGYITFWHVLEHIYDVRSVLVRMKDLLASNGRLIVALPNYQCLEEKVYKAYWNGYDVPRHLWHFNHQNFIDFSKSCGFRLLKTHILPLDPFYNCLISESYRKKKWGYILIPLLGFASLILGWLNHKKASSIVYILEMDS